MEHEIRKAALSVELEERLSKLIDITTQPTAVVQLIQERFFKRAVRLSSLRNDDGSRTGKPDKDVPFDISGITIELPEEPEVPALSDVAIDAD